VYTHPINPPFRAAILGSVQAPVYDTATNSTPSWDALAEELKCSAQPDVAQVRASRQRDHYQVNPRTFKARFHSGEGQLQRAAKSQGRPQVQATLLVYPSWQEPSLRKVLSLVKGNSPYSLLLTFPLHPEYGLDNTTAFLAGILGNHTTLIDAAEQLYSIGSTTNG
jgi:hypothetical protein